MSNGANWKMDLSLVEAEPTNDSGSASVITTREMGKNLLQKQMKEKSEKM